MEKYSAEEYEKFMKAGEITARAIEYGKRLITIGSSLLEVSEAVEKKVLDLGGEFAFPPQISLNSIAAHYCADPDDKVVFKKGDLAKLDVGVTVDGYVGDSAATVDLGDNAKLVEASSEALKKAIEAVRPGAEIGEIGKAIQEAITSYGFAPVKNLSGHSVGQYIFHGSPSIPNYNSGDKTRLEKGEVIAIEPFATTGMGVIYESGVANIFSQVNEKPVRNMITRQVLSEIGKYRGMPFTTRWLARKFPLVKVNYALRELSQLDVIRAYPPLPERAGGLVSQAEHTMIVEDPVIITTKLRE
jgi:methionyl aminopeptidase